MRTNHMEYLPDMEVLDSSMLNEVIEKMNSYDYNSYTEKDVRIAINRENRTPEDFAALLSPAALPFLEEIAQKAQEETRRFCHDIKNNLLCMNEMLRTGKTEEAAEYSNIGINRLYSLTNEPGCPFVLYVGKISRRYMDIRSIHTGATLRMWMHIFRQIWIS